MFIAETAHLQRPPTEKSWSFPHLTPHTPSPHQVLCIDRVPGCGSSRPPSDATFAVHVSVCAPVLSSLIAPSQYSRRAETRQECLCLQFEFSVLGTNPRASYLGTESFIPGPTLTTRIWHNIRKPSYAITKNKGSVCWKWKTRSLFWANIIFDIGNPK